MLSSSEKQICDQLGITERDYLKHRATGLDARLSLNAAKGTGKIASAIECCRRVVNAAYSDDETKLATRRSKRTPPCYDARRSVGREARHDDGFDQRGNRMLAMPIRTR